MSKNVTVKLVGIYNDQTGSDGGAALEVYGDLYARRMVVDQELGDWRERESKRLWHRASGDAQSIGTNNLFPVGTEVSLTVNDDEFLWVGGHLAEHDDWPNANDNLGFVEHRIHHNNLIAEPRVVHFRESDQLVQAKFMLMVS